MTDLQTIKQEVNTELADPEVVKSLLATSFKDFSQELMAQAILEIRTRGFEFKDVLEKNVYAVKFGSGYTLITSIDYARKVGMRSGVVGKSAPVYTEAENGKILTCTVTVKRKVNDYVGDYTATVYFDEYNTGKNLWATKPRTMIAKVAELHALRSACPEEMSQVYVEEEIEKEKTPEVVMNIDVTEYEKRLRKSKDLDELKKNWLQLPASVRPELESAKNSLKEELKEEDNEKEV